MANPHPIHSLAVLQILLAIAVCDPLRPLAAGRRSVDCRVAVARRLAEIQRSRREVVNVTAPGALRSNAASVVFFLQMTREVEKDIEE